MPLPRGEGILPLLSSADKPVQSAAQGMRRMQGQDSLVKNDHRNETACRGVRWHDGPP